MTTIPITSIKIARDRQRRGVGNCDDLIASIRRHGLIVPICIDDEDNLIAGERRLFSLKKAGIETLEEGRHFIRFSALTPLQREEIELEENIKRRALSWQEEIAAIVRYHNARVKSETEWTQTSTADALSIHKSAVSRALLVMEHAKKDGTILEAQKLSVAVNTAERNRSRQEQTRLDNLLWDKDSDNAPQPIHSAPSSNFLPSSEDDGLAGDDDDRGFEAGSRTAPAPAPIHLADVFDYFTNWTGPRFNFLHCDFPYGIDFQDQPRMNATNKESYDDSFDVYKALTRELLPTLPIADSAHLMFWFSPKHFEWTKLELMRMGWTIDPYPLIWFRSDGKGMIPDTSRRGRYVYEWAFHCWRGDRKIVRPVNNLCACPRGDTDHASAKPEAMLEHFFRMYVDESSYVLDPTCGSGSAVRVAARLGAERVLGIEKDPDFHTTALSLWYNQPLRGVEIEL